MLQMANIESTWKRRKRVQNLLPDGLAVHPAAAFGRLATAVGATALAVVAFDPPVPRASDARTANHRRRSCCYWTVSCSKLPIRASLKTCDPISSLLNSISPLFFFCKLSHGRILHIFHLELLPIACHIQWNSLRNYVVITTNDSWYVLWWRMVLQLLKLV